LNEIDLNQCTQKLIKLQQELDKPLNVSIKLQLKSFTNKIFDIALFNKGNYVLFH